MRAARNKHAKQRECERQRICNVYKHTHTHPYKTQQPHSSYFKYLTPPAANLHNPITSLPTFHLRSIVIRDKEKQKGPIYTAKWDPTGRRLLTGSESGYLVVIQGTPIKTWMVGFVSVCVCM
jgi:hypothetical protein